MAKETLNRKVVNRNETPTSTNNAHEIFVTANNEDAVKVFEFASENSKVEFNLAKASLGKNKISILRTDHNSVQVGSGHLNKLESVGFKIIEESHNHPGNDPIPSGYNLQGLPGKISGGYGRNGDRVGAEKRPKTIHKLYNPSTKNIQYMIKIKLIFLLIISLAYSCTIKDQNKAELNSTSIKLIEKLEDCYNAMEFVTPLNPNSSFVQINIVEEKNIVNVEITLIEKGLVYGKSRPNFVAKYKGLDVFVYGSETSFLFTKLEKLDFLLDLKKTKKNQDLLYDPVYLKVKFDTKGYEVDKAKVIGCNDAL